MLPPFVCRLFSQESGPGSDHLPGLPIPQNCQSMFFFPFSNCIIKPLGHRYSFFSSISVATWPRIILSPLHFFCLFYASFVFTFLSRRIPFLVGALNFLTSHSSFCVPHNIFYSISFPFSVQLAPPPPGQIPCLPSLFSASLLMAIYLIPFFFVEFLSLSSPLFPPRTGQPSFSPFYPA